jgi:polysaccharide export outer membrane protein
MLPQALKLFPRLAVACALVLGAAACSNIIPGLNVRAGSGDQHEYKVSADDENGGYKVEKAAAASYEVVELNAETLLASSPSPTDDAVAALPSILPSDIPAEYQIGPGDIVYVTIWEHPELTSPFSASVNDPSVPALQGRLVAADGSMFYPYVGVFTVAGMTSGQLRSYLGAHLTKVLTSPQIDVRVVAFRSRRIEVTGEVGKPGTITLDDTPKGVLQAIAASGGLTATASRRRLILVRGGKAYNIDLSGLLSGDRLVNNPALQGGDVIHIPDQSGDQVFVLGAVGKQQQLLLQQDSMSLIQALSQAGGLDRGSAKQSGVLVFRGYRTDDGVHTTVYTMDLSRPSSMLVAGEFKLQPRDVVYVQATPFFQYNTVINQLLPTVEVLYELNSLHRFIGN